MKISELKELINKIPDDFYIVGFSPYPSYWPLIKENIRVNKKKLEVTISLVDPINN